MSTTDKPAAVDMNALLREQRSRPRWDPFAKPDTDTEHDTTTDTTDPKDAA
jgi:hypothetical protein